MSDMIFPQRSKNSQFRQPSLDSGSSNEYSLDRDTEYNLPSSLVKGSELNIKDDEEDLDSLPIDFSKLVISTDANGQIQVADKEQFK